MDRDYSIAETKDQLTRLLRLVEAGDHVHITRRGKAVAVLVSVEEFDRLAARRPGFADALAEFDQGPDAPAAVIDDAFLDGLRESSPGREVDL